MADAKTSPSPADAAEQRIKELFGKMPPRDRHIAGLYTEPLMLLRDAIVAYYSGAYGASMIACRATIEAAGFIALTSIQLEGGAFTTQPPLNLSGDVRRVEFEEVKKGIAGRRILGHDLLLRVDEVQTRGNYIAHVGSKTARLTQAWKKIMESIGSPEKNPKGQKSTGKRQKYGWVSQKEVLDAIECAESVILALVHWSRSQPAVPLSSLLLTSATAGPDRRPEIA